MWNTTTKKVMNMKKGDNSKPGGKENEKEILVRGANATEGEEVEGVHNLNEAED